MSARAGETFTTARASADIEELLPVRGPVAGTGRWVAPGVGHSDGDAPLVPTALAGLQPVTVPDADDR
ncbi:hypothetical protein ACWCXX_22775 [Streptomyces sp. NPDC001732]